MEEYIDWTGQAGSQEAAEEIAAAPPVQHYNANPSSYAQDRTNGSYLNPNFPSNLSCDIKPRLTKEQHDILENHYQKQNKPNTNTKKSFAESLNVSLDKVNNWFQNRRAKSKQDAKKHAGLTNIFQGHRRAASESDSSPGFVNPSSTYHTHMQQWTMEQGGHHGLGIASVQEQQRLQMYGLQNGISQPEPLQSYLAPAQFSQDVHDELNRRTLTQDQFSAIEQNGGILDAFGNFEDLGTSFFGDQGVMNTVFPPHTGDIKQQEAYIYPVGPVGPPLSSYDSTVPSNVSEQSLPVFPSNPNMQTHANAPSPSDWADSRSATTNDSAVTQSPPQPQTTTTTTTTTAQWTPGQSVPVDPTAQYEAFQQAAAMAHERASPQLSIYEQPSPWADEAYLRRASTTSLLAHSMSAVGIHTPPQYQGATFKSPAPPSNIAARRQRARPPAQLSMTNLRSQSHSGVAQPGGSPLEMPQPPFAMGDQPLRRIRSSNYLGSVAHGRVQKSTPNSANRSPMHYTFADAANSSQAVRHGSQGSLAPPTPMSPKDSSGLEQAGYIHQFQVGPGNSSRQASMHENDAEHTTHAPVVVPAPNRTSPPHTPANYQQQFVLARVHSNGVMENTPPQSAPAGQTCFPSNVYAMPYMPQQSMQQYPVQPQAPVPQHMHAIAMSQPQPQRFVNPVAPDQQFQMSNVVFAPNQHVNIPTTGPPPGAPIQFSQGVPMTNADGNIELVFPPQLHFVHQHQGQSQTPPQHMHTPPQISYPFGPTAGGSPGAQASTFQQKPAHDFFVHEWAPPESVRRSATPRKGPFDTAPKNYAFANTGPEHFDAKKSDEKKKRLDSKDGGPSSSSPASSDGTALTA